MENENVTESAMYALGMIQGIKLTLLKISERINEINQIARGTFKLELENLIAQVNEFPTVKENGQFIIEPNEGYPTFEWIQERRDLIAKHLKG